MNKKLFFRGLKVAFITLLILYPSIIAFGYLKVRWYVYQLRSRQEVVKERVENGVDNVSVGDGVGSLKKHFPRAV